MPASSGCSSWTTSVSPATSCEDSSLRPRGSASSARPPTAPAPSRSSRASAGPGERRPLRRIAIRSGGRIQSLPVESVFWFEAADNYLKIHAGKSVHLIRERLSELERRLDPEAFIRIHRGAIVRIESILAVESLFHGDYEAVLRSGERLPVGRRYRERLLETIGLRR